MPTICDLLGIEHPVWLQGSSLWKYIRRFDDHAHPVLANCDDSATRQPLVGHVTGEPSSAAV